MTGIDTMKQLFSSAWGDSQSHNSRPQSVLSRDGAHLDYIVYRGKGSTPESPLLVCVHGLKRNPIEQIFRLAPLADRLGLVLLAPHFSRRRFRHFQWLAPAPDGSLPEALFHATISHCTGRFRLKPRSIDLLGFSGGAQFVHRYAMIGQAAPDRMILISAGWYTMPLSLSPYPLGCSASEALGNRTLDPRLLLDIPTLVVVGSRDKKRGSSLNTDPRIDKEQGRHRRARARRFVSQLAKLAERENKPSKVSFEVIEGASHNFTRMVEQQGVGDLLFDWFQSYSPSQTNGAKQ